MALDHLRALRIFVKVIDEGSFAGASRALDMTTSSITRSVADLEDHLGSRLINRTTRSLSLTEVGATYLERVRTLLDDLEEADAQASAATGEVRGRLRVASTTSFLASNLTRLLPVFQARHPLVSVQLNAIRPGIEPDEGADVTILVHHGPDPLDGNFVARLLAHTEVILCASPAYLAARGRPSTPEALLQHEVLVPDLPFVERVTRFRHADGGDPVLVETRAARTTSAHPELLVTAARDGLGIAGALSFEVARDLERGTLERVLPDWDIGTYQVYAAMPSRKHLPARTRRFIEFLLEQLGGQPADPWLAGAVTPPRAAGPA